MLERDKKSGPEPTIKGDNGWLSMGSMGSGSAHPGSAVTRGSLRGGLLARVSECLEFGSLLHRMLRLFASSLIKDREAFLL